MKTLTSTKATTNTALVVATLALVAAAALAWGSANFAGLTTTCAGPGLSAAVYGGGKCCSGLILQGGICNVPPPICAPEGQALGPAATIKCCAGLILQNGVCKKCVGAGLYAYNNPCCEGLVLQGGICNVAPPTCAPEGTVLGPSATIKCCANLTLVGGKCTKSCIPNCTGKKCGSDGCGGSCGACLATQRCSATGQCTNIFNCIGITPAYSTICSGDDIGLIVNTPKTLVASCTIRKCEYRCNAGYVKSGTSCVKVCTANCTGKCGGASDGCTGTCNAVCPAGQTCQNGQCVTACTPNCTGKTCGDNGCGGSCGTCTTGQSCMGGSCWYTCTKTGSAWSACPIGKFCLTITSGATTGYCVDQCFLDPNKASSYADDHDFPCGWTTTSSGPGIPECNFMYNSAGAYTPGVYKGSAGGNYTSFPQSPSYPWTLCPNGCINTSTIPGDSSGSCVTTCTPNCINKTCGDNDGCGGSCGTCATGYICLHDVMSSTYSCKPQCFTPNASSLSVYSNIYDLPCGYIDGSYCVFVNTYTTPIVSNSGQRAGIPLTDTTWNIKTCPSGCINNSNAPGNSAGSCGVSNGDLTPPAIDSTSPAKQILISGNSKVTVYVVKLGATSAEALDLKEVKITDVGAGTVASQYYLYSSVRSDGKAIADPIAVAAGGKIADFMMPANTVVIPASGDVVLTVKIDVSLVDGTTIINGTNFLASVAANTDIKATGKSSGQEITIINAPIVRASGPDVAYASRPYFSVNAVSPSGTLVPGVNSLIAIFNVKADDADDITFINTAGNYLKIDIASSNIAGLGNFTIRDETGTTLDSGINVLGGQLYFDFDLANFIISKGMTKKLYLYGNTSALNVNDTLQAYLNDTGTNLSWSINYNGGNYSQTDIIFRNGIYAGALRV